MVRSLLERGRRGQGRLQAGARRRAGRLVERLTCIACHRIGSSSKTSVGSVLSRAHSAATRKEGPRGAAGLCADEDVFRCKPYPLRIPRLFPRQVKLGSCRTHAAAFGRSRAAASPCALAFLAPAAATPTTLTTRATRLTARPARVGRRGARSLTYSCHGWTQRLAASVREETSVGPSYGKHAECKITHRGGLGPPAPRPPARAARSWSWRWPPSAPMPHD